MDKIKKLIEMANTQFHDDYVEQQKKDLSEINQRGLGTSGLRFDIQKKTLFEYIKLTLNYKVEIFEENLDYLIKTQQLDSFLKWFREHIKTYSNATFNTFVSNVKRDYAKFQLNDLGSVEGLKREGKFELSRIQGETNRRIAQILLKNEIQIDEQKHRYTSDIHKFKKELDELFNTDIEKIIKLEESKILEFKSSFRWNVENQCKDVNRLDPIVKTICAFLNSYGGSIVVGISDNKEILGLENDFALIIDDNPIDKLLLKINTFISDDLGKSVLTTNCFFKTHTINNKHIFRIDIFPSKKPILYPNKTKISLDNLPKEYKKIKQKDYIFYIRQTANNEELTEKETAEYCLDHFI